MTLHHLMARDGRSRAHSDDERSGKRNKEGLLDHTPKSPSAGGWSTDDIPSWVSEHLNSQEAQQEARESEERIARMAERKAAQFSGK